MLSALRHGWAPLALKLAGAAWAATLTVGPGQAYRLPSQAVAAAAPGDTVRIEPGTYADCVHWATDNLTVEGTGPGVELRGKLCENRGIFIIDAEHATLRNLTFADAAIPEGNGSGIRAQGLELTIENCAFIDNQDGILTANRPQAAIFIRNSSFEGNGACVPDEGCAHGVYIGTAGLVRIEHSRFIANNIGHHVKSRALRTELFDDTIEDGPKGTSSYLVDIPNGGTLIMRGDVLEKGPRSENGSAAISIGEEGANRPGSQIRLWDNTFTNDGEPTVFVRNMTRVPARLIANTLKGNPAIPLSGPGTVK